MDSESKANRTQTWVRELAVYKRVFAQCKDIHESSADTPEQRETGLMLELKGCLGQCCSFPGTVRVHESPAFPLNH